VNPESPVAPTPPTGMPPQPMAPAPSDPMQPMQPMMPAQQPAAMPQPAKRRLPKWAKIVIIIVGILIVVSVAVAVLVINVTAAPVKVSDEFMKDLQANDAQAAYALASSDFRGATSQAELTDTFAAASPALQGTFSAGSREVKSKNGKTEAEVLYTVTTDSGKEYTKISLIDTSTGWQILGFDASDSPYSIDL